ncbi:helix-turn-helix transcriptional regulator [Stappia sp. TSB10P1A]|uniref:helix-turn-helix domain-containing protein n=1 Tax=Stappia sp. TSB10P1A TaxID=2003585 RepID=UPI001643C659|nr:helix-turn-helix transcriptional regulator [Stappia sp. TSB10P1A]
MEPHLEAGFLDRLKLAIKESGGPKLAAERTGIPLGTLNKYLAGTSQPPFNNVVKLSQSLGRSLEWLATGEGEMLTDAGQAPPPVRAIDPALFRQVGRLVARVHKEEGVRLPPDALLGEQADAYNAVITRAEDPADPAELEALLPWLEARLRRRLQTAAAAPGTGKRPAS